MNCNQIICYLENNPLKFWGFWDGQTQLGCHISVTPKWKYGYTDPNATSNALMIWSISAGEMTKGGDIRMLCMPSRTIAPFS